MSIANYCANREWRRRAGLVISAVLAVVMLVLYYPHVTDDSDIWWHLRYGATVVQQGDWRPDHAVYSWTPASTDWVYVSWLGSTALYGLHQLGGFAALAIWQWLVFMGIAWLYAWLLRLGRQPWSLFHVAVLFLVGVAINPVAVYLKPDLFSLFFFALTVAVYFAGQLTGRHYFWIYPALFLAWVNTHGAFVNGLAFLGIIWLAEGAAILLGLGRRMSRDGWLKYSLALLLSIAATFINPYGWRYGWGIVQNILAGGEHMRVITAYSDLWTYLLPPPFMFRAMNAGWCLLGMAGGLAALLVYAGIRWRHVDAPVMLVNGVFFALGFTLMRASMFFAVLCVFSWAYVLAVAKISLPRGVIRVGAGLGGVLAGIIVWESCVFNTYWTWFGWRLNDYVPAAAVKFIRRNQPPGPLFNDYLTGGYLLWTMYPEYKVFIDSRYGPYQSTGVFDAYARLMRAPSPPALVSLETSYPFQSAVIDAAHAPLLADLFLAAPGWRLVYFDAVAAVFVKQSAMESRRWMGDMSPHRFDRVANPDILARVFALYCSYRASDARVIYDIYEHNVSRWYAFRNRHLDQMRRILAASQ